MVSPSRKLPSPSSSEFSRSAGKGPDYNHRMIAPRRQVVTYLLLVFAFSAIFYFLMLRAHSLGGGAGLYVVGIMWCPALAGMLTLKLNRRSLAELGWRWPQPGYMAMSWFIPLMYAAIAYAIVWTAGLGGFPNHDFMQQLVARMGLRTSPAVSTIAYVLLMGSFGLARSLSTALGEEIGWRGFLVPQLSKTWASPARPSPAASCGRAGTIPSSFGAITTRARRPGSAWPVSR